MRVREERPVENQSETTIYWVRERDRELTSEKVSLRSQRLFQSWPLSSKRTWGNQTLSPRVCLSSQSCTQLMSCASYSLSFFYTAKYSNTSTVKYFQYKSKLQLSPSWHFDLCLALPPLFVYMLYLIKSSARVAFPVPFFFGRILNFTTTLKSGAKLYLRTGFCSNLNFYKPFHMFWLLWV